MRVCIVQQGVVMSSEVVWRPANDPVTSFSTLAPSTPPPLATYWYIFQLMSPFNFVTFPYTPFNHLSFKMLTRWTITLNCDTCSSQCDVTASCLVTQHSVCASDDSLWNPPLNPCWWKHSQFKVSCENCDIQFWPFKFKDMWRYKYPLPLFPASCFIHCSSDCTSSFSESSPTQMLGNLTTTADKYVGMFIFQGVWTPHSVNWLTNQSEIYRTSSGETTRQIPFPSLWLLLSDSYILASFWCYILAS